MRALSSGTQIRTTGGGWSIPRVCVVYFPFVTRKQRAHEFRDRPLSNRQVHSRCRGPPGTDQAPQSFLQLVLILSSTAQRAIFGIRCRHTSELTGPTPFVPQAVRKGKHTLEKVRFRVDVKTVCSQYTGRVRRRSVRLSRKNLRTCDRGISAGTLTTRRR